MEIRLQNIGIIRDSTLQLNGLTVITGKNNSGKTTVGKTLYAILDAVADIQSKAKTDKHHYILTQLEDIQNILNIFHYMPLPRHEDVENVFSNFPKMKQIIFSRRLYNRLPSNDIERFAHDLESELKIFNSSLLEHIFPEHQPIQYKRFLSRQFQNNTSISNVFDEQKNIALSMLQKLFDNLSKDLDLTDYTRESINQTLQMEFSHQIQPVKMPVESSKIELSDDSILFSFTIKNNNIVNTGAPIFFGSPFKKVHLIDNPSVLEDFPTEALYIDMLELDSSCETILNTSHIYSHQHQLSNTLRSPKKLNIFEKTVLDHSLKLLKKQIDQIIPGTFEFSEDGDYYIQNGTKLKISNLATGSKMFSILKMLLDKGEIDSTTMLILDEPEAHLHPKWQNFFAETIVLLVKELGVNILLTTHSPNFMLALDAYMRKYDISDKTNFYQTDELDNGFVQYHCVNDDLGKIYDDFLQYLSEVKVLRNQYLNGEYS